MPALVIALWAGASPGASSLPADTVSGWEAYVRIVETRMARELASPNGFLAHDFAPAPQTDRSLVMSGQVGVVRVPSPEIGGKALEVPEGMVHHWRGSVFIPATTIDRILARVANPSPEDTTQDDVQAARVLGRGPGSLRLFLRLQRSQIVTVVYNTEHTVHYVRHDDRRASSRSVATRIAEVAQPGTAGERERPIGQDRGFLWRLNSYWRYEAVGRGVMVECESISLSRSVPALLRGAVRPIIDQVARGSMERTLAGMRARLSRASHGD